jgi:hypothetical protein
VTVETDDPYILAVVHPERFETWRLDCMRSDANFRRDWDAEDYLRALVRQREREYAARRRPSFEILPAWE